MSKALGCDKDVGTHRDRVSPVLLSKTLYPLIEFAYLEGTQVSEKVLNTWCIQEGHCAIVLYAQKDSNHYGFVPTYFKNRWWLQDYYKAVNWFSDITVAHLTRKEMKAWLKPKETVDGLLHCAVWLIKKRTFERGKKR